MILGETYYDRQKREMQGVRKFALFPHFLEDGRIVWLEDYLRVRVQRPGHFIDHTRFVNRPCR